MPLTDKLTAIANAVRSKTGESDTMTLDQMPNKILAIDPSVNTEWHQCPEAVRSYLEYVAEHPYSSTDYTYTYMTSAYVPTPPQPSRDTKPIGKTIENVTYYNEIPLGNTSFSTTNVAGVLNPLDHLRWLNTATYNVRDIGGWACDGGTIKYGMLVRGGEPVAFDKALMVDQIGIKHELQLRGHQEVINDLNGRFYSLWDIKYTCPETYNWMTLRNKKIWKEVIQCVFDCVNKYSQPLYFHCASGADRTGTVAVILEALLGMSQSNIDQDYELTCFATGISSAANARLRNEDEYKNFISEIKAVSLYGGLTESFRNHVVSFILSLGFTIDEINMFRANMIVGNPETISITTTTYTIQKTLTNVTSTSTETSIDKFQQLVVDVLPNDGYVISSYSVKMNGVEVPNVFSGTKTDLYRRITYSLSNCTIDNMKTTVVDGQCFGTFITANSGYTLDGATVTITMGGIDVSEYYSNGSIVIPSVTGNVVIEVEAIPQPAVNLYTGLNCEANARIATNNVVYYPADPTSAGHFVTDFMEADCSNGIVKIRCTGIKPWMQSGTQLFPYIQRVAFYDSNKSTPWLGAPYVHGLSGYSDVNGTTVFEIDGDDIIVHLGSSFPNGTQSYINDIRYFRLDIALDTSEIQSSDILTPSELSITVE